MVECGAPRASRTTTTTTTTTTQSGGALDTAASCEVSLLRERPPAAKLRRSWDEAPPPRRSFAPATAGVTSKNTTRRGERRLCARGRGGRHEADTNRFLPSSLSEGEFTKRRSFSLKWLTFRSPLVTNTNSHEVVAMDRIMDPGRLVTSCEFPHAAFVLELGLPRSPMVPVLLSLSPGHPVEPVVGTGRGKAVLQLSSRH